MTARFLTFIAVLSLLSAPFALGKRAAKTECRVYTVNGVIRGSAQGFQIVQAEGTRSARTFLVPLQEEPALLPYIDAPVTAHVRVTQAFDATQVTLDRIEKIELRVPDPIREQRASPPLFKACEAK